MRRIKEEEISSTLLHSAIIYYHGRILLIYEKHHKVNDTETLVMQL